MRTTFCAALAAAACVAAAGTASAHQNHIGIESEKPGEVYTLLKAPRTAAKTTGSVDLQLLTVSDWHGQLEPLVVNNVPLGGGAALKTYFDQARSANPNTLTFMAGDSVGATPPVSSFFEDTPAIEVMNRMGIDADTLGNHNFDAGIGRLQQQAQLADFPFLSANLKGLEETVPGASKRRFFSVGGVRVAVIGITNEEAPTLVAPGSFGPLEVTDGLAAAEKAARQARSAGAEVVVILTHKGIRSIAGTSASGELVDFSSALTPGLVDVVVGDHTDFAYSETFPNGVLAVENRSKGATFAKVQLTVARRSGVTSKGVTIQEAKAAAVPADPGIAQYIADRKAALQPILGQVIGQSPVQILRSDSCGRSDGRLCESRIGDVVTDALRTTYGTDFALTNSGGLRDNLTCQNAGGAGFCPNPLPATPPFLVTKGTVVAVLPFGNQSATTSLSGAELRQFLETSVKDMPSVNGRFAQVSGLCFTYDIQLPPGSRVTSTVRPAADGSCTGETIAPATTYTLATNDFVAAGGDGYPNIKDRTTTRDLMDADLARYVADASPLDPGVRGRIVCIDSNTAVAPACPTTTVAP